MGVSILMLPRGCRKERDITPGLRSMMAELLGPDRMWGKDDLDQLAELRDTQLKGQTKPPFDYSDDVAASFDALIAAIKWYGWAYVRTAY